MRRIDLVLLAAGLAIIALWLASCGGPRAPADQTIRELCAPGADLARAAGHVAAVQGCGQDASCKRLADAFFETGDALAAAYCPKVPVALPPQDGGVGAGGGPAVHVAPPPAYGNKVVRNECPPPEPPCYPAAL